MTFTQKKHAQLAWRPLCNLLTLRYDPEKQTREKKLFLRDFRELAYKGSVSEKVESILKNQIRDQVGHANNVVIPLGSGIDSALIMALAKNVLPSKNIIGMSLGFDGPQDETHDAQKICDALGVSFFATQAKNVLRDLPQLLTIVGEPRWNLWYYYVLEASQKLKADVILTGDGGDELFGGYVFRYSKYLKVVGDDRGLPFTPKVQDKEWIKRAWAYLQCHDRDWVPDQQEMFGPSIYPKFSWRDILQYFKPYFDNGLKDTDLSQVFLADYNGKLLYDWIPTNSQLSNYFGIKMASPFLSDSILEYAPHIGVHKKYDSEKEQGKLVLREILERYGIMRFVGKSKLGFGMDLSTLWNSYGRRITKKYLWNAEICRDGLINEDWLHAAFASLESDINVRYVNKMLHLLSLEIWYRVMITKSMPTEMKIE